MSSQLGLLSNQRITPGPTPEPLPGQVVHVLHTGRQHHDIELGEQIAHNMPHTLFSHNAQAPDPQTSDPDKLCTQTERFHHVGSPTHPGVVHNCQLGADVRVDDVFEGVQ